MWWISIMLADEVLIKFWVVSRLTPCPSRFLNVQMLNKDACKYVHVIKHNWPFKRFLKGYVLGEKDVA